MEQDKEKQMYQWKEGHQLAQFGPFSIIGGFSMNITGRHIKDTTVNDLVEIKYQDGWVDLFSTTYLEKNAELVI